MKKLYAEWEKQDGTLLCFPHKDSDWKKYLEEAQEVYCKIIYQILQVQACLLITQNRKKTKIYLQNYFLTHQWDLNLFYNLYLIEMPTNDTWARDFGGITIYKNGQNITLNYGFNGWGLKFAANLDNQITNNLQKLKILQNTKTKKLILEGGSIESNGNGILLTTTQCLLEKNRNPAYSQKKLTKILKKDFGLKKILWLHNGFLEGDDTNSHIDTLARFINSNTITYLECKDRKDKHYKALLQMKKELKAFKNLEGKPFSLIPLPFCLPKYYANERLPATYANFLFINNRVLLPIYQDSNDQKAIEILQNALPKHKIIPIDCSILIRQHGSLHCISMQFPYKTLNFKALQNFRYTYV